MNTAPDRPPDPLPSSAPADAACRIGRCGLRQGEHPRHTLWGMGGLLLLAALALAVYTLVSLRMETLEAGRRTAEVVNLALGEQIELTLEAVDLTLKGARDSLYRQGRDASALNSPQRLEESLRDHRAGVPSITALFVTNDHGDLIAYSGPVPGTRINVSDRDYFLAQATRRDMGLYISTAFTGRISQRWQIALSRRLEDGGGKFLGVIVAAIDISYFETFFTSVLPQKDSSALLFRQDGRLLVRSPRVESAFARDFRHTELFTQIDMPKRQGTYEAVSNIDDRPRLVSFRVGERFPVISTVSLDLHELLSPWRLNAWRIGLTAAVSIGLFAGLLSVINRQLRQMERQSEELAASEERFHHLVEHGADTLLVLDEVGRIVEANRQACTSLGYRREELIGCNMDRIEVSASCPPEPDGTPPAEDGTTTAEARYRRAGGEEFPVEVRSSTVRLGGRPLLLIQARDISERKALQELLERAAKYDSLTGLPTRPVFIDRAEQALVMAGRMHRQVGFLFIDLDRFKAVNDRLGHAAGDAVLKESAVRLTACLRQMDTVCRFGGDEFVVLLPEVDGEEDVRVVAEKILQSFSEPFQLGAAAMSVTASVGMALFPEDGQDAEELLCHADAAMYQAKQAGRNDLRAYHPAPAAPPGEAHES